MRHKEIKSFVRVVIFINLLTLLITSIVLLIIGNYSLVLGYLLGSIISNLTFLMHAYHVSNLENGGKHPFISAMTSTALRLLISAGTLAIALFVDMFNLYATFAGLLTIKLIIFIVSIILEKKKEKLKEGGEVEKDDIIINE